MEERTIKEVAQVLLSWNPLGDRAARTQDLDGYRTEAIDILFHLKVNVRARNAQEIVRDVLNQAFQLSLTPEQCKEPTASILRIAGKRALT